MDCCATATGSECRPFQRGGDLAVWRQAVDNLFQVRDRGRRDLEDEAVLAGDAVALQHLGHLARQGRHALAAVVGHGSGVIGEGVKLFRFKRVKVWHLSLL